MAIRLWKNLRWKRNFEKAIRSWVSVWNPRESVAVIKPHPCKPCDPTRTFLRITLIYRKRLEGIVRALCEDGIKNVVKSSRPESKLDDNECRIWQGLQRLHARSISPARSPLPSDAARSLCPAADLNHFAFSCYHPKSDAVISPNSPLWSQVRDLYTFHLRPKALARILRKWHSHVHNVNNGSSHLQFAPLTV